MRSRPYQHEAFGPSGTGPWTVAKTLFFFGKKRYVSEPSPVAVLRVLHLCLGNKWNLTSNHITTSVGSWSLFWASCWGAISRFWDPWQTSIAMRSSGMWQWAQNKGDRSMKLRFRDDNVLLIRVFDLCVKLLTVLHISNAQGRSVDLSVTIETGRRRTIDLISTPGRLAVVRYGA